MILKMIGLVVFSVFAACQGQPPTSAPTTAPAATEPDGAHPAAAEPMNKDQAGERQLAPEIEKLLDRIERGADDLSTFTADIVYEREDALLGRKEIRTGKIIYRVQPMQEAGDRRVQSFAVLFDSLVVNQTRRKYEKHYIFHDRWLVEVDHENKQFIKRELVPPGEQIDPLKLGEGPFPLPIGQKKSEVLARFDVTPAVVPSEGRLKGLEGVEGLLLVPKSGTREAREFKQVELFFDATANLPVGIVAIEQGEGDEQGDRKTVRLSNLQRNTDLSKDQIAKLNVDAPADGWNIDVRAWKDE